MSLDANLALAAKAIKYLKKLRITSTNVPFRVLTYQKSPFSALDRFIIQAMRVDTTRQTPFLKDRRRMLLEVLRDRKLSKRQVKDKVKTFMAYWGADFFDIGRTWQFMTMHRDETRIRSVRKAIKFRHGNCMEKSALVATWLWENNQTGPQQIVWMAAATWDHGICVFDSGSNAFDATIANWSDDAVLVDGWTGDYYQAKHPADLRKGNHLPNPFQIKIRNKLSKSSGQFRCAEMVQYGDSQFAPGFRLEDAGKSKHQANLSAGEGVKVDDLQGIVDDIAAVGEELTTGG